MPPPTQPTHLRFKKNVAALSIRHLLAYFLSTPFLCCHFFLKHLKLQQLKRSGRWLQVTDTRQHSGHWQHPGAAGSCRQRCIYIVKGDVGGTRAGTLQSAYEYGQAGLKMWAGQTDGTSPAFLRCSTHSFSKRRIFPTRVQVCDATQEGCNHSLRLMCTG